MMGIDMAGERRIRALLLDEFCRVGLEQGCASQDAIETICWVVFVHRRLNPDN